MQRIKNQDSKLGGVCLGIAAYYDLDVTLVRACFVALFFTPVPIFTVYLILWIFLPETNFAYSNTDNIIHKPNFTMSNQSKNGNMVGGLILIILGAIFSFKTFFDINLFSYIHNLWPLLLIGLGVWLIVRNNDDNHKPPLNDKSENSNITNY